MVINWLLYAAAVKILPMEVANLVSWGIIVVFAYLANKCFVFSCREWDMSTVFREVATYFGARGVTGCIEVIAQPLLYHMGMRQSFLGVEGLPAKILVSLGVALLNYFCTRALVFRESAITLSD